MFSTQPAGADLPTVHFPNSAEGICQTKPQHLSDIPCAELELDEGLDYFAAQGERDRQRMEGRIA
jgi:hypothetical protein